MHAIQKDLIHAYHFSYRQCLAAFVGIIYILSHASQRATASHNVRMPLGFILPGYEISRPVSHVLYESELKLSPQIREKAHFAFGKYLCSFSLVPWFCTVTRLFRITAIYHTPHIS